MTARKTALLAGTVLASLVLASTLALSADDATAEELAARAATILDDTVSPNFDEAQKDIEESLRKHPSFSRALLQKARLVMIRGGESPESLREAEAYLRGAMLNDFNYAPIYVMQGYVYSKLGKMGDAHQAFFRAERMAPNDPDFLFAYAQSGLVDPLPYYERFIASDSPRRGARIEVERKLLEAYFARRQRAKADAAHEALEQFLPTSAVVEGDYARGVMMFFGDFDAGEKYARRALALNDYPHARASLSLALYGRWAQARRDHKDPDLVASFLGAAQANDPGAAQVPSCSLAAPSLAFVKEAIESLGEAKSNPQLNC